MAILGVVIFPVNPFEACLSGKPPVCPFHRLSLCHRQDDGRRSGERGAGRLLQDGDTGGRRGDAVGMKDRP